MARSSAPDAPPILTPREAAACLGVSDATVRRWLASGELAGVRVGGRLRIERQAVVDFVRPGDGADAVKFGNLFGATPSDAELSVHAEKVRAARIEAARRCSGWTELGRDGFELCWVLPEQSLQKEKDGHVLIFKRPKPPA